MDSRRVIGVIGGLAVIGIAVAVLILAWPRPSAPAGGAASSPTARETPPATPSASSAQTIEPTNTPGDAPTPSLAPDSDVIVFTNPDGPDPVKYAIDEYPLFEIARALSTFGQIWVDDNQRDVHLAVTGDIDGAIEAIRHGVPRGVTVYIHPAQYTEAELCATQDEIFEDRDELMRHGILLTSGGCGNMEMRINIGMSPLTPEAIAYMRDRYEGPIDYEAGGFYALRPAVLPEPDDVRLFATRAEDDLGLSTCGRRPFPTSALDAQPVDMSGDAPELVALREDLEINTDLYGDLSVLGWTLVEKDAYGATFIADRGDTLLEAPVLASVQSWVPGTIDYCEPRLLDADDSFRLEVFFDPGFAKPSADATELHLMVSETGCHGFSSPFSRMLPPTVEYEADTVKLSVRAQFLGGPATCPGTPPWPVTIVLSEPLGDRKLQGINGRSPF